MAAPPLIRQQKTVHDSVGQSVPAICDRFLEWVQAHRAAGTYVWYQYRLQRFVKRYPDLTLHELRPYHVQEWVDSYELSPTSQGDQIAIVAELNRDFPFGIT